MKIKRVLVNNRKKAFIVETRIGTYEFPYALLKAKPSSKDAVTSAYVDKEIGEEGFTYELRSKKGGTVLLEQILYVNKDPDIMREKLLYELSCKAQTLLADSGVTKRALARKLAIPPAQLYRLLDQSFYGKTIDQMIKLLCALGHNVTISTRAAA